jgi:UDP-glucuronate 4-epimerase
MLSPYGAYDRGRVRSVRERSYGRHRMRALVTGAAGFIGSHLVERLAAEGHVVVAVDCLTPYYDVAQKEEALGVLRRLPTAEVVEADLWTCDIEALVGGIDVVFHQAGQPGVRDSWRAGFEPYVRQNVLVTQRLLDAVVESPVDRFVFASSSSVYGNAPRYPTSEEDVPVPQSPYGVTKLAAEHLCGVYARNWAVPAVSLRYFTVYGPRQRPDMAMHRMIEAGLAGNPFPLFGNGEQIRDFTYVDDAVEANVLAASADIPAGSVINVAGKESVSLVEVIHIVEDLIGRPIVLDRRPGQPGDVLRTGGSDRRAATMLGWFPRIPVREGLRRQVAWHRARRRMRALDTSVAARFR